MGVRLFCGMDVIVIVAGFEAFGRGVTSGGGLRGEGLRREQMLARGSEQCVGG